MRKQPNFPKIFWKENEKDKKKKGNTIVKERSKNRRQKKEMIVAPPAPLSINYPSCTIGRLFLDPTFSSFHPLYSTRLKIFSNN